MCISCFFCSPSNLIVFKKCSQLDSDVSNLWSAFILFLSKFLKASYLSLQKKIVNKNEGIRHTDPITNKTTFIQKVLFGSPFKKIKNKLSKLTLNKYSFFSNDLDQTVLLDVEILNFYN